jgi:hypothetical protein
VAWNVIAAVASLLAAACALQAVRQAGQLRREARQQILADALITMINATEKNPGYGADAVWDERLLNAVHQVQRATGLALLGLAVDIKEPVLGLLDPPNQKDTYLMFQLATKAYDEMRVENGGEPILPEPSGQSLVTQIFKRLLVRASERLRRVALRK